VPSFGVNPAKLEQQTILPHDVILLVDWLRQEWYEPTRWQN